MCRTWPEWKDGWDSYFKDKPDKPVMFTSIISGFFGDHAHVPPGKYYTMFNYLEYPFSRGSIQIRSPDPYDPPIFDAGFMKDSRDVPPMVSFATRSIADAHLTSTDISFFPIFLVLPL